MKINESILLYISILSVKVDLILPYKRISIEDAGFCYPENNFNKKRIKLGNGHESGLIVSHKRLNDHPIKWGLDFICPFQVDAYAKHGIFAVIQNIVFRINSTTKECIDYIQFRSKEGITSPKYCGSFNTDLEMDPLFKHSGDTKIAGNAFKTVKNELHVYIFVSKEPLDIGEEMDFTIVFTAFDYCDKFDKWHSNRCGEDFDDGCIYDSFINDGYVNCPYIGCFDEGGCSKQAEPEGKKSIGNKVFIGSVSTLAVLFLLFVVVIYACKKHKVLCWSLDFASPSTPTPTTTLPPQPRVLEMQAQTGERLALSHTTTPTAHLHEDDKPPPYDSLFPPS